jgi:hypothetical protein
MCVRSGMTPLMNAVWKRNSAACELLIQRGSDIEAKDSEYLPFKLTTWMFFAMFQSSEFWTFPLNF